VFAPLINRLQLWQAPWRRVENRQRDYEVPKDANCPQSRSISAFFIGLPGIYAAKVYSVGPITLTPTFNVAGHA
jgi:hypothetical protein